MVAVGVMAGAGTTATNLAVTRLCTIWSVTASSRLPASWQISFKVRRPSTRKKTFHSSGVMFTLCFTRSGLATVSTAMPRSGKTSSRRPRSSIRRAPSMSRFCRSISRVTAVAGGGTPSQKVKTPWPQRKVSKMTSETWTLRHEPSSASVRSFSATRIWPRRWPAPPCCRSAGSMRSASTLPMRTTIAPRRKSSLVEVAKTGRPSRRKSLVSWSGRSITRTPVRRHMLRKVRRSGASNRARFPSRTFSISNVSASF